MSLILMNVIFRLRFVTIRVHSESVKTRNRITLNISSSPNDSSHFFLGPCWNSFPLLRSLCSHERLTLFKTHLTMYKHFLSFIKPLQFVPESVRRGDIFPIAWYICKHTILTFSGTCFEHFFLTQLSFVYQRVRDTTPLFWYLLILFGINRNIYFSVWDGVGYKIVDCSGNIRRKAMFLPGTAVRSVSD